MFTSFHRRLTTAAFLTAVLTATLTGCGGDAEHGAGHPATSAPAASVAPGADHNDADVAFARDMIPHHAQAIEMAELASTRAADPKVKELAAAIEAAQDPEIQTMTGWLKGWGQQVPPSGHTGGHSSMPGMMSEDEMRQLRASTGRAFDTAFLTMMIRHHEGAIEMARTEQREGRNADAKKLAATIERAQTAEIAVMRRLLAAG